MAAEATVTVRLADLEPVTSFIVRVVEAERLTHAMTAVEVAALPDNLAAAVVRLQSAVRDLGGCVPSRVLALETGGEPWDVSR